MTYSSRRPAYRLHTLVAAMDTAADALLDGAFGVSYPRFLTLLTIERLGEPTQRELAAEHGVSEPATSRMVQALADAGYVTSTKTPGGGNRRTIRLTDAGRALVADGGEMLESAFDHVLTTAQVKADAVVDLTESLIAVIAPHHLDGPDVGGAR